LPKQRADGLAVVGIDERFEIVNHWRHDDIHVGIPPVFLVVC